MTTEEHKVVGFTILTEDEKMLHLKVAKTLFNEAPEYIAPDGMVYVEMDINMKKLLDIIASKGMVTSIFTVREVE